MIACAWSDGTCSAFPKAYLQAASPVFARMMDAGMAEDLEHRIDFTSHSKEHVLEMLQFFDPCKGRLTAIDVSNVEHLLPLFHLYDVDKLYRECCELLAEMEPTPARVALALKYAVSAATESFVAKEAIALRRGVFNPRSYDADFIAAVIDKHNEATRRDMEEADEEKRAAKKRKAELQNNLAEYVTQTPEARAYAQMKKVVRHLADDALRSDAYRI